MIAIEPSQPLSPEHAIFRRDHVVRAVLQKAVRNLPWLGLLTFGAVNSLTIASRAQVLSLAPQTIQGYAGTGTAGYSGDGYLASLATISSPGQVALDEAGNLYVADTANNVIRKITPTGYISTVAGTGTAGYSTGSGVALAAQLSAPEGVAVDTAGNLYIADTGNQIVRKVTPSGAITTVAGKAQQAGYTGNNKGATQALLSQPWAVAFDSNGNFYISERGNNVVREVNASGIIAPYAGNGTAGSAGDNGPATAANLNAPEGIAFDASNNLYIADSANDKVREVSSGIITTYRSLKGAPSAVAVSRAGVVCIAQPAQLSCVSTSGVLSTVAGNGTSGNSGNGGPATSATVGSLSGVAIDVQGRVYLSDTTNSVVRELTTNTSFPSTAVGQTTTQTIGVTLDTAITLSGISIPSGYSDFTLGTVTGCNTAGANAAGTTCSIPVSFKPAYAGLRSAPLTLTIFGSKYTFPLTGVGSGPVFEYIPGIISTFAGNGTVGHGGDGGSATAAQLNLPHAAAVGPDGSVYIADMLNGTVRKVSPSGTITTFAGTPGTNGYSGDLGPATSALLNEPSGVAVDAAGNVYIAEFGNSVLRKVDVNGTISTVAGNRSTTTSCSSIPTSATTTPLNHPTGVAIDANGNVYIASGQSQCVLILYPSQYMAAYAGTGTAGFSGDTGVATGAQLNYPQSVAIDANNNLYIADSANNRVRQVSAGGTITTLAGNGTAGYSGDGGFATSAELNNDSGVAVDAAGNVYIGDNFNERVRVVDTTGYIYTVAGNGTGGYSGDGGVATAAQLQLENGVPTENNTYGLAVGNSGNLYLPDAINNTVRLVNPQASAMSFPNTPDQSTSSQTISILNEGTSAVAFSGFTATTGFSFNTGTCSTISALPSGSLCSPVVGYSPTSGTAFAAGTASATDLAPGSPHAISLTGTSVLQATTTAVSANPSPGTVGTLVTLTAIVSPQVSGTPTGTVTFYNNGVSLGSVSLSGGVATLQIATLTQGTHTITATYGGSTAFTGSTSAGVDEFIDYSSATTLSVTAGGVAVSSVAPGTVVSLTATVKANGVALTNGIVNFCDAAVTYCTDTHLLGSAALTSNGTATIKLVPGRGTYSYYAAYQSTSANQTSKSTAQALTVTGLYPTTTTIAQAGVAGNYTLIATVTGTGNGITPTGTVSFQDTSNANYVLGTAPVSSSSSTASYTNVAQTNSAGVPRSIVNADFNGDGIPDLAVTSQTDNKTYIFLGTGTGTFTAAPGSPITLQNDLVRAVAGDFNHDGKVDLAVTCYGSGTVALLLGNGDGTFQSPTYVTVASELTAIATADLNSDGNLDLVVASQNLNNVYLLIGNGAGGFTVTSTIASVNQPYSIAIADVNGDGYPDLLVGGYQDSSIQVLLNNGAGSFTAAAKSPVGAGATSFMVATGDFRGNGKTDAIVTDSSAQTITVLSGNGDGTFSSSQLTATASGIKYATTGDFNQDGKLDFVTCDSNGTVGMYYGNGDGTFQSVSIVLLGGGTSAGCQYISSADYNGDGTPDLSLALLTNNVQVALGTVQAIGTATLTGISPVGNTTHYIQAAYPGDTRYSGSTSATTGLTAQQVPTTLTLSSSGGLFQQTIFTATLSPYSAQNHTNNNETITFYVNGSTLGTAPLANGIATFNAGYFFIGNYTITASYAGDNYFLGTTSAPFAYAYGGTQTPSITFTIPTHHTIDQPFTVSASSNSTGTITYSILSGPATISGNTVTLTGATGTVTVEASQASTGIFGYSSGSATASFSVIAGSVWIGNSTGSLSAIDQTGGAITGSSGFTGAGVSTIAQPVGLAFDSAGDLWIASSSGVSEFDHTGKALTSTALTTGGVSNPAGIAVDGTGNVWVANSTGTVSEFSNGRTPLSPSGGLPAAGSGSNPAGIAIDISGNVWIPSKTGNSITMVLGAASPVVPLANGEGVQP